MNAVHLIGRTTKEIKIEQKGETSYAIFTLAVYRSKTDTDYIDCVVFNKTAEYLQTYVKKGEKVAVTGSIATRIYKDKNGTKRKGVEVQVSRVEPLNFTKKEDSEEDSGESNIDAE